MVEIENLIVECIYDGVPQRIVNDLSIKINKKEILGIIGESGCGKSTTALTIANLLPSNFRVVSGSIKFDGTDVLNLTKRDHLDYLKSKIGFIFQDPMTSLNPLLTVGKQVSEKLILCGIKKCIAYKRAIETMKEVGLLEAEILFYKYPYELSGGMRQRIMIAIAIINKPQLIIADEPTTALDPTIQAQILQLLKLINNNYNCSILLISHNFGVINQICDRLAVMYKGEILEQSQTNIIFENPKHPYTKGLMECLPDPSKKGVPIKSIPGGLDFHNCDKGCNFSDRCAIKTSLCLEEHPAINHINSDHYVRCIHNLD